MAFFVFLGFFPITTYDFDVGRVTDGLPSFFHFDILIFLPFTIPIERLLA